MSCLVVVESKPGYNCWGNLFVIIVQLAIVVRWTLRILSINVLGKFLINIIHCQKKPTLQQSLLPPSRLKQYTTPTYITNVGFYLTLSTFCQHSKVRFRHRLWLLTTLHYVVRVPNSTHYNKINDFLKSNLWCFAFFMTTNDLSSTLACVTIIFVADLPWYLVPLGIVMQHNHWQVHD